jgi:hypothetical protein
MTNKHMKKILYISAALLLGQLSAKAQWTSGTATFNSITYTTANTTTNSATSGYVGIGGAWTPTLSGVQARLQVFGGNQYALRQMSGIATEFAAIELGRVPAAAGTTDRPDMALAAAGANGNFAMKAEPGDVILRSYNGRLLFNSGDAKNGDKNTVMALKGTTTTVNNSLGQPTPLYGALVGIGNTSPVADLDLSYDGLVDTFTDHMTAATTGAPNKLCLWRGSGVYYGMGTTTNTVNYFSGANHSFYTQASSTANRALAGFISTQGMGVGVTAIPAGYAFAVGGKMIARELKITATTLPDYVFSPAYRLRPLAEVDTYIQENGHLPEVPSAVEVAREGGINVSEMQATLLKKVEELTLYMIEQHKQLQSQQQQLEQVKQENQQLKTQLQKR